MTFKSFKSLNFAFFAVVNIFDRNHRKRQICGWEKDNISRQKLPKVYIFFKQQKHCVYYIIKILWK